MHLVPSLPPASLTPAEQPPTELLTQGKIKEKSVINDALFPLWKERIRRASFVILVFLEPQTQRGFASMRNYYYAVGTVLYNNLSF